MGQHHANKIELSHTKVEYVIKYLSQNTSKEGKRGSIQNDDIKVYIGEPWRARERVCLYQMHMVQNKVKCLLL